MSDDDARDIEGAEEISEEGSLEIADEDLGDEVVADDLETDGFLGPEGTEEDPDDLGVEFNTFEEPEE